MILYRFGICNVDHLVLVVGMWLLEKMKIFENLSGFQGSATINSPTAIHFGLQITSCDYHVTEIFVGPSAKQWQNIGHIWCS